MSLTLEEKKELVESKFDPDELCEALDITTKELLDLFEDRLLENWVQFDYLEDDLYRY